MDFDRFVSLVQTSGWRGLSLWGILLVQAILWVSLVRLHLRLRREEAPWEEVSGKVRSAFLRQVNAQEELQELSIRSYAPLVDRLLALKLEEGASEPFIQWLRMQGALQDGLRSLFLRWAMLGLVYGGMVWFLNGLREDLGASVLRGTPCDPRLAWLWPGYALWLLWKLLALQGHLQRLVTILVAPRRDP